MILLVAVAALAVAVPLCGGRLGALASLRASASWLLLAALALQVAVLTVPVAGGQGMHRLAHVASYGLAGGFVWANRRMPGLWLVGAGGVSNLAAIASNGGVMPASPAAFAAAGIDRAPPGMANSAPAEGAPLWLLGDVFALPAGPLATVFSAGDVLLVIGAGALLWRGCGCRLPRLGPSAGAPALPGQRPLGASSLRGD